MTDQSWKDLLSQVDIFHREALASEQLQYEERLLEMRAEITMLSNDLNKAKRLIARWDPSASINDFEAGAEQCQTSVAANNSTKDKDNAVPGLPPDAGPEAASGALPPAPPPAASAARGGSAAEARGAQTPAAADPVPTHPRPEARTGSDPCSEARYLWRVAGGDDTGGIRVQIAEAIHSPFLAKRLCTGALVEGVELCDDRLHFRLLAGLGPTEGWIFTKLEGKTVAMRLDRAALKPRQLPPMAVGPNSEVPLPVAFIFSQDVLTRNTYDALLGIQLPEAKKKLDKAKQVAGFDMQTKRMPLPTSWQYPLATFLAGIVGLENLKALYPNIVRRAAVMTGMGQGLYMALVAAGVLSFEDALKIVKFLFELHQEAAASLKQGICQVIGLDLETLWPLCLKARNREGLAAVCEVTAYHDDKSFVVSGTEMALGLLESLAMKSGAQVRRQGTVAWHCELLRPFQARFEAALDEMLPNMKPPLHTLWMPSCAEPARPGCDPADIVAELKCGFTSPVLFYQTVVGMFCEGNFHMHKVSLTPGPGLFTQWMS